MRLAARFHLGPALAFLLALVPALSTCAAETVQVHRPLLFGVALEGNPITPEQINLAAQETRLPLGVVNFFVQWPAEPGPGGFPLESVRAIDAAGALPCITWEPMHYETGSEVMIPAEDILSGRYDVYIDDFANTARQWGRPVLVRFAHEMNLARYHWGTDAQGYGPESPALFAAMYRHVAQRLRAAGADNLYLAFCPNSESIPNDSFDPEAGWNTLAAWWPGAEYVDVLGMDGYNWGDTRSLETHGWQSSFRSFVDIFGPARAELRALAPDLPLLVFETAGVAGGGDKGAWIEEAFATARDWGLAGLVWFQAAKEEDWRMQAGSGEEWRVEVAPLVRGETDPAQALGLHGGKP